MPRQKSKWSDLCYKAEIKNKHKESLRMASDSNIERNTAAKRKLKKVSGTEKWLRKSLSSHDFVSTFWRIFLGTRVAILCENNRQTPASHGFRIKRSNGAWVWVREVLLACCCTKRLPFAIVFLFFLLILRRSTKATFKENINKGKSSASHRATSKTAPVYVFFSRCLFVFKNILRSSW